MCSCQTHPLAFCFPPAGKTDRKKIRNIREKRILPTVNLKEVVVVPRHNRAPSERQLGASGNVIKLKMPKMENNYSASANFFLSYLDILLNPTVKSHSKNFCARICHAGPLMSPVGNIHYREGNGRLEAVFAKYWFTLLRCFSELAIRGANYGGGAKRLIPHSDLTLHQERYRTKRYFDPAVAILCIRIDR